VVTDADLAGLPPVVRRYFEYSGVLGKPRIASFSFTIEGRIRQGPEAKRMPFISRQYNLLSVPSRVFYIRASKTPISGIDSYLGGRGRMNIKLMTTGGRSSRCRTRARWSKPSAVRHLAWNRRGLPPGE
jgi:hypothetical protein